MKQSVEFAPFYLKEGVSEKALLQASENMQKHFLEKQEGFEVRYLIRKSEREFVDVVIWSNPVFAQNAMQNVNQSSVCLQYFELMEIPDEGVSHFDLLGTYTN